ncbi:Vitamin K-dependent protein C (Fragment) [Seminavis robusta]|uniref:Vitamin K-dependent protein C n=1 Tax=Seminavis robusta TaxID=568900 RepID=A0A9N8DG67_9STRA
MRSRNSRRIRSLCCGRQSLIVAWCFLSTAAVAAKASTTNVFASEELGSNPGPSNILRDRQSNTLLRKPRPNQYATRIIGGSSAKEGRYPYIVAILTEGGSDSMAPACGGTLIAPDIVLTAAHCRNSRLRTVHVGRYDRTNPSENFESFTIEEMISHPEYKEDGLDHDIMILKLSGVSNTPPVTLNRDPTIPSSDDDLLVLGFGVTQVGGDLSLFASETMQVGIVQHVPNDVCDAARSPGIDETYQGRITEDMLCAWGDGVDACQGDSGSGMIAQGRTIGEDVQVGITSWGFRCAHPDFPGVYSRVSHLWDWIASQVCSVSREPPLGFKCHAMAGINGLLAGSGTNNVGQQSTTSSSQLVAVTLKIRFDSYASEVGWTLKDSSGKTIAAMPYNSYEDGRTRAIRTFFIPEGRQYTFIIEDSYRDGLCCTQPGHYALATRNARGETKLLIYGMGDFGAAEAQRFVVPTASNSDGNTDEEDDGDVISSLKLDKGTVPMRILLRLDENPTETGWILQRIGFHTEIVARMPTGAYTVSHEQVIVEMDLEEDELYRFVLLDEGGNGIDGGRIRIFIGRFSSQGISPLVFNHDGSFTSSLDHTFLASQRQLQPPAPLPASNHDFLTLEIRMDLYPEEIGFQVRADTIEGVVAVQKRASDLIFFRPPRFYNASHTNQVVHETIPLPQGDSTSVHHFSLIMIDASGDGLCCRWQGRLRGTGYVLFHGDPINGEILVSSSFTDTAREAYSFGLELGGVSKEDDRTEIQPALINTSPNPLAKVSLRVIVMLDDHPYETGYKISDSMGRLLVDVAPGKFRDENTTVKETFSLFPGVYTFAIIDSHGDGIAKQAGEIAFEVVLMDANGITVVSGDGQFEQQKEYAFVIEGELATVPVLITMDDANGDGDKLDIGFQVERLDLPEADAVVATFAPGQHLNFDQGVTGSLVLQSGGLYRLSLLGHANITGTVDTRMAIGSKAGLTDVDIHHHEQSKFLARPDGEQLIDISNDEYLSLSIPPELHSHEIDWVLLVLDAAENQGQPLARRAVISYGPDVTSAHEDYRNSIEMIPLPQLDTNQKQSFMLIVSHSAGEGCCVGSAKTGLIQLFQGHPDDKKVLVGTSFDGKSRLVEIFHLFPDEDPGSRPSDSLGSTTTASSTTTAEEESPGDDSDFLGTGLIVSVVFVVMSYLIIRTYRGKDTLPSSSESS